MRKTPPTTHPLAAAQALKCTYCMLAHGSVLRKNFFGPEELAAIARDFRNAGLPAEEVMLMEFAQSVVLTVTARNFVSKTLDALGTEPDEALMELEPKLREALVVGRPFPSPLRR